MDSRSRRIYCSLSPSLVVPNHFFCNESSTLVAIYDEPLGEETDGVALIFPGDVPGSSPQRVVPKRVGTRTLVFSTPVYTAANRGVVEVLPVLGLASGEVELPPFKIGLKHPIRNVMELCINHSTNEAVLPVLISLMVHCDDGGKNGYKHFQDPHIDRIMATLVGSRPPGSSTSIKDILLPSRKWMRMNLAEFGREFELREMEKQAYVLKNERLRWAKRKREKPRAVTMTRQEVPVLQPVYENTPGSLPLPRKRYEEEQVARDDELDVSSVPLRRVSDETAGQPITDERELKQLPKYTYTNVQLSSDSEDLSRNVLPIPVSHAIPIPTGPPLSPLATSTRKFKAGLKKTAFDFEDSSSETSELADDSDYAPEETSQAGPSQQQRHAVRGKKSQPTPALALTSSCPPRRRNWPALQPRTKLNRSTDGCAQGSSSPRPPTPPKKPGKPNKVPLLPPAKKKTQQVEKLAKNEEIVHGHIYTVPGGNVSVPPRDIMRSKPPLSTATKVPIFHTKSAPPENIGSKTVTFNPPPHSQLHLTASNSHPGHKARSRAMGVPVLPVATYPSSKGHSEADSGWSSAVSSTDTDTKTVPQDDEDYDDITIHYTPQ